MKKNIINFLIVLKIMKAKTTAFLFCVCKVCALIRMKIKF